MEADGKSLLAISDVGSWMTADIIYEGSAADRPCERAPRAAARQPRPAAREQARAGRRSASRCSMAHLQRGTVLIGFERLHRIGRFPVRDGEVWRPSAI